MTLSQRINGGLRRVPAWPLYILTAVYTAWMFWLAASGQLGVEPINTLEREYGEAALILLIVGLVVTPLRDWTGISLVKFRRAIGLSAFFLVVAHFAVFAVLDVQSLGRVVTEVVKRPYVTVGFAAFVLLIPLAVTSNNRSIRKLGPVRWRNLHKLTYPAAVLGGLHYIWLVKGWPIEPFVYMGAILVLLVVRLKWARIRAWMGQNLGSAKA
ncbi:protein-methionine-sulfoxide reductase heme-binding subunit MsrQ [Loktanella sp. SALINAS62]|uniref:protein-methionine-sulfoxide reductase heme-binding subunit MsrQ n=1 Tax=Loktanella sp. SALINAS62 TaxID=2706124 RepID=UPI001B8CA1A1|nr:protein-methionine-sulfoxide reductase heme-binding subunit MsrQ [Loktanella sp. SALINAS62]MBS1301970.1 protein-methionine-sulfoxide reductase heme-binding subunit MsrQ [Loktanella sp. SALINAS62]